MKGLWSIKHSCEVLNKLKYRGFPDDLLNIDNNFFDSMVNHIYFSELQLNKANVSDTDASVLGLYLSISDGFVKTKINDK